MAERPGHAMLPLSAVRAKGSQPGLAPSWELGAGSWELGAVASDTDSAVERDSHAARGTTGMVDSALDEACLSALRSPATMEQPLACCARMMNESMGPTARRGRERVGMPGCHTYHTHHRHTAVTRRCQVPGNYGGRKQDARRRA